MIMEIRAINTLKLIDTQEIKSRRKYEKMCKKLTKLVLKHDKKAKNNEFLIRVKQNSYIVKSGKYGFVIGLKKSKSRWL
ncbi:MAG: hypothetical protein ACI4OP_01655 [Candidatus Coprovivens sp.]